MINAFRQIRLTNSLLTVTGSDARLQVGNRQVVYTDETGDFGSVGGSRVTSLNTLTGALTASGFGNITVTNDGSSVVRISGDVSNLATAANLVSTGSNLQSQITVITNTTGNFWAFNNRQVWSTGINPTGIDNLYVGYPSGNFSSIPKVFVSIEVTGDILYAVNIRNRTISGYTAIFSDLIAESGVILHSEAIVS